MKLLCGIALAAFACMASATITKCGPAAMTKENLLTQMEDKFCNCPNGCKTCVNEEECVTVQDYYFLKADKTAGDCATGCTGCTDATISTCTGCGAGYIALTDKSCALIDALATWCKTWAKDTAGTALECTALADGFFGDAVSGAFTSGTACTGGCTGCTDNTLTTCTGCPTGYIALTDKSCALIDAAADWCKTWAKDTAGTALECTACAAETRELLTQANVDAYLAAGEIDSQDYVMLSLMAGETIITQRGFSKSAAAASTVTVMTEALCMADACSGAKTCTVRTDWSGIDQNPWFGNQGGLGEYEYEYASEAYCPAPPAGSSGSNSGSGPDAGDEAAAGTVQASAMLLAAAMAIVAALQ